MNEIEIVTTKNIDSASLNEFLKYLRTIDELNVQKSDMFFKSAGETPEFIKILADLATWSTVFKLAATAFLTKLGALAAEDLWRSKGEIALTLKDKSCKIIRDVSQILYRIKKRSSAHTEVLFSIPVPDRFPGATLTCPAESEEEIAVYIVCFAMKSEAIVRVVEEFASKYSNSFISVRLELLDTGSLRVELYEIESGDKYETLI